MNISLNWLREYIDTNLSDAEIAEKLTLTGLEVEEITSSGSDFSGIVVGEVLSVKSHPNADKLTLCEVNTGTETVQIVCGAPNVAAGQKVPVATVGTELPVEIKEGENLVIRKSKIRGEASFGMICAEDELGIGTDHSGIMVLDPALTAGTPFSEVVKPTKDSVIEIGLTPNRPDAACHVGTARDLHAVTGEAFKHPGDNLPSHELTKESSGNPSVKISILNDELCHRYVGIVMKGINVSESPVWVQQRLKAIGLRPRNAIVDATNYVLHEMGQPLHAFDLKTLSGAEIQVKSFDKETSFTTLDETKRKVPAGSLFICDAEKPVALAGVMGGINSEISDSTTEILIESAWFEPVSVRKTSRSLALQTDSSYRFERGVDPTITLKAALRCAALIQEWCGGSIEGPVIDINPVVYEPKKLTLRPERANKLLGTSLSGEAMAQILQRLGFLPEHTSGGIECTIPAFRPDVSIEVDLIEEIARIYDYNNIPTTGRITFARPPVIPFNESFLQQVRLACVKLGLQEIYSNSLLPESVKKEMSDEMVELLIPTLNPISRDQAIMRPDLSYGFLRSAAYNFNRKASGFRAFEIGRVFTKGTGKWIDGVDEHRNLLIAVAGNKTTQHWQHPETAFTFHDLKALTDSLFSQLRLGEKVSYEYQEDLIHFQVNNTQLGIAYRVTKEIRKKFELDNEAYIAEINLDLLAKAAANTEPIRYKPVPKYPAFEYDIALITDSNVNAGEMQDFIRKLGGRQLADIQVFDVFEGKPLEKGQKSVAFRLLFQDSEKTLTIKNVEPKINKITKGLSKTFGAQLRA
ncbi:MAG: phenylalanine--tRNA ligase subunit beta [Balneolia bacterium]|nr:phenylalanine--tRNA ligase subunit beta [Balneolia bacterium]